ncbi:hypothetical protein OAP56_02520 [Rickettsiaceae bacterium]|nr:hypothetical protein [Rickettsiaceae bacterium]
MKNRGSVSTGTIASKLKKVENELGITSHPGESNQPNPLLFVNGRLDRKNCAYIAKNFSLLEPLNAEIKRVCKGSDLTILNYLIFLGLKEIKDSSEFRSIEYSEFESKL